MLSCCLVPFVWKKKSYLKEKGKRHKGLCAKNRANSLCNRADQFKREPREFIADFHGDGNYWKLFQNENQATGTLCCYSSLSFTTISQPCVFKKYEWVSLCGCECVCLNRQLSEKDPWTDFSEVEGQMFWCGQKKTSHHLWCENCSWADGLVKLSWFSVFFYRQKCHHMRIL